MLCHHAVIHRIPRKGLRPLLLSELHRRHRDGPPSNLDRDLGSVNDISVPGGRRSPSGRDDKAVIGRIMFDNFEYRLTLFSGNTPDVMKDQDPVPEYRAKAGSV